MLAYHALIMDCCQQFSALLLGLEDDEEITVENNAINFVNFLDEQMEGIKQHIKYYLKPLEE